MPLFRRRDHDQPPDRSTPPSPPAVKRAVPAAATPDWRTYDSVAEVYARTWAPRFEAISADLVELVGIPPRSRALDVGTGTGVTARAAAKAAGESGLTVGVDPSVPMLGMGRRAGGGPRYASAVALDLPFADGTFGYVVSTFVVTHFPSYETGLFDMIRVLAPGGRLGLATWGENGDAFGKAWRQVTVEFAEEEMIDDAMNRAIPWHEHFADPAVVEQTLRDAGLREPRVEVREYRTQMSRDDLLASREASASGRFMRDMLGEELWESFHDRAAEVFAERFPPQINDFRQVILSIATKP